MVAAFKRQEGTLATAANQHPDACQPGVRAGEVVTDGLQMWDDAKRSRNGSGGALKQGAGWIAEVKRPGGKIESRKFEVRTWGSWRLAFLLARLQRALWDEEFGELSNRETSTAYRPGSEASSGLQEPGGALRRRFRSKSVDPARDKDAAVNLTKERSASPRQAMAVPSAATSSTVAQPAMHTTIAANEASVSSAARNQTSHLSYSATSTVATATSRATNTSAASLRAKPAEPRHTSVESSKASKIDSISKTHTSNSVVADNHVQLSSSSTSAATSSSSAATQGNKKRLASDLVQNSDMRAKTSKSSSPSEGKQKIMPVQTEVASAATLATAHLGGKHSEHIKTRIPGLEACLERGSGIGKRCVRQFVSLMRPNLTILDQTLLVNHLRLTEGHEGRLKRFVEQGGVARLLVWIEAALMLSGSASDLFLDCTFKALRLLPLRGMEKGAAKNLLEVIDRVRSRMSKAKLTQQPVQTTKAVVVARGEKVASSSIVGPGSGPSQSKGKYQGRVGKGDGKSKDGKGCQTGGPDEQTKADMAQAEHAEMPNLPACQSRPGALKKPMPQSHHSSQHALQQMQSPQSTVPAQPSTKCEGQVRRVTPSVSLHEVSSVEVDVHKVKPSFLLSLPKTPPLSHSAPSTPPHDGKPWQGPTEATGVEISCLSSDRVLQSPKSPLLRHPQSLTILGNAKPIGIARQTASVHIAKSIAITSLTAKNAPSLSSLDIANCAPKTPPLVHVRAGHATLPPDNSCSAPRTPPIPQPLRVDSVNSVPKTPPLGSTKPAQAVEAPQGRLLGNAQAVPVPSPVVFAECAHSAPTTPPLAAAKAVPKSPPNRKAVPTPALAAKLHIEAAAPKTPPLQDLKPRQQAVKAETSPVAPWQRELPQEAVQEHYQPCMWNEQQSSMLQQLEVDAAASVPSPGGDQSRHVKAEPVHPRSIHGKAEPEAPEETSQLENTRWQKLQETESGRAQTSREQAEDRSDFESACDLRFLEWSRLHEEVSALEAQISAAAAEDEKDNMKFEDAKLSTRLPPAFNAKVQELERQLSAAVSSASSSASSAASHAEVCSAEPSAKTPQRGLVSSVGLVPASDSESEEECATAAATISSGTSATANSDMPSNPPRQSRQQSELVNMLETLAAIATSTGDSLPALPQDISSSPGRLRSEWTANQNPVSASSLEELLQSQTSASSTQMCDSQVSMTGVEELLRLQASPRGTSMAASQVATPISSDVTEGLTDALVRALSRSTPAAEEGKCAVPSNPSEPEQGNWQQNLSNNAMSAAMSNFTEAALANARATEAARTMLYPEVTLTVNPQVASAQMLQWQSQYLQHQLQQAQWAGQYFTHS